MKKVNLLTALVLCALLSIAAPKNVALPQAVKTSFNSDYPAIKNVSWDMENGDYEASFKLNGVDASVVYDKAGHKKDTEIAIKSTELPAAVLAYVKKNYATYKLLEAAKITSNKNELTYEAEVSRNGEKWDVLFDANGNFLKQVKP